MQIVPTDTDAVSVFERRVAGAKRRRARRAYIEAVGGRVPASTPMWVSRAGWLATLSAWVLLDGAQVLRARAVRPDLFLAVCVALAAYADGATGRHCAVTNARLAADAGCSERTVSTVRAILRECGFAVLAQQGCGGAGQPNRVAVYHLMSRPVPVENRAVCDLPPLRSSRGLSPVGKNSPRPAAARPRGNHSPKRQTRPAAEPRPLALQRLAGQLVARAHGLGAISESGWQPPGIAHIGAICDALAAANIDPTVIAAADVGRALDADARSTGWVWPDRIANPAAFLAYRLGRIGPALRALANERVTAAAPRPPSLDKDPRAGRDSCAPVIDGAATTALAAQPADPAVRAAAMDAIRAVLVSRNNTGIRPSAFPRFSTAAEDAEDDMGCAVCGLPPRRAHVCDACWAVAAQPTSAPTASVLSVPSHSLSQQEKTA